MMGGVAKTPGSVRAVGFVRSNLQHGRVQADDGSETTSVSSFLDSPRLPLCPDAGHYAIEHGVNAATLSFA